MHQTKVNLKPKSRLSRKTSGPKIFFALQTRIIRSGWLHAPTAVAGLHFALDFHGLLSFFLKFDSARPELRLVQ
jgi:hypothetical protein